MLHEFLNLNRNEVIYRCKEKAAVRSPQATAGAEHGVPLFLDQLVGVLRIEQQTSDPDVEEEAPPPQFTAIGREAALHGAELLTFGFSIGQVVNVYGDVCQVVTGLAIEQQAPIGLREFETLNRCLDNAIADAVTAFADRLRRSDSTADKRRRLIDVAIHTFAAVQTRDLGLTGATATVHANALVDLRELL